MKKNCFFSFILLLAFFNTVKAQSAIEGSMRRCLPCQGGEGGGGNNGGTITCPSGASLYVNADRPNDEGNGTTWATAKKTLQAALDIGNACNNIKTIYVAAGIYKASESAAPEFRDATFFIGNNYSLIGGYPNSGGENRVRDYINNPVILDGDIADQFESYHVLTLYDVSNLAIDGFQIRNGFADGTGSIEIDDNVTMRRDNGAGVYLLNTVNITFENCAIYNNVANSGQTGGSNGGGIYSDNAQVRFTNCVIANNIVANSGGAIYSTRNSKVHFNNSTLYNNIGIIGDNVADNRNSNLSFTNTIVWNAAGALPLWGSHGSTDIKGVNYCIIAGGYTGIGNLSVDPEFRNPADPDGADNKWFTGDDGLNILSCSQAINRAVNAGISGYDEDITGKERIINEIADIGAYEYQFEVMPGSAAMLAENRTETDTYVYGGTTALVSGCKIIASVLPNQANPLWGRVKAISFVHTSVPQYNDEYYVARHYDISPQSDNPSTATAKVTLYFTQDDFDNYNTAVGTKKDHLPASSGDAANKAKLRVNQFHGISSDGRGLPGSYDPDAGFKLINPEDEDIEWHPGRGLEPGYWSVSFNVTGFSGFFITAGTNSALPVTFINFTAILVDNEVKLNWQTASEQNSSHFVVQRSANGIDFENRGRVNSAGNSNSVLQYGWTDDVSSVMNNTSVLYYRLQQADLDGKYDFSRIEQVKLKGEDVVHSIVNPVQSNIVFSISTNKAGLLYIRIIDMQGRIVLHERKQSFKGNNTISLPAHNLAKGIYLIEVMKENSRIVKKLIKE